MVDQAQQGRGYGRAAIKEVLHRPIRDRLAGNCR